MTASPLDFKASHPGVQGAPMWPLVLLSAAACPSAGFSGSRAPTHGPGQTAEASIRLEQPGQVRGRVQLPAAVASAFIFLKSPLGSEGANVAPAGTFLFGKVVPGDYVAKVECPQCSSIAPKPVKLMPGGNVELVFP